MARATIIEQDLLDRLLYTYKKETGFVIADAFNVNSHTHAHARARAPAHMRAHTHTPAHTILSDPPTPPSQIA